MSYQGSVALRLQDETVRNYRRRNTGQKFSGVLFRNLEISSEKGRHVKKYPCGFFDRRRLLAQGKNPWGLPMQVWGALRSGFILEVLGTRCDPVLPEIPGLMPCACSVHIHLYLNYDVLRFLPSWCTKAILFLSR